MLRSSRLAATAIRQAPFARAISTTGSRSLATPAADSNILKAKPWANPYPEDMFAVGHENGFLPRKDPLETLPQEYEAMETLLNDMRLQKKDGTPGLLATGDFGAAVERDLPEYDVSKVNDGELLSGK